MSGRTVPLPGGRDAVGTLDDPGDAGGVPATGGSEASSPERGDGIAVACPPHPEYGGRRSDRRLVAVSEALRAEGYACLRFDYGPWDRGYGEREDARNALRWAADRYDRVALVGYSFGGAVAALAAADPPVSLAAVSLLAPASRLAADLDAADALGDVAAPVQVVYGERDDTADWRPLVERARELDCEVTALPTDHAFVGRYREAGERIAAFLAPRLRAPDDG